MKFLQEEFTLIHAAIRNAELEPRSYSGRGMFGKQCLGFVSDNVIADCVEIALSLSNDGEVNTQYLFDNVRTDSMGRSTIVYFPSVPWLNEKEKENGDE